MNSHPPAMLALEDGRTFLGISTGAEGERGGELVFNTAMTGYQEILSDPSYAGQIVVMTYPEIGNYGINGQDMESVRPHLEGFVMRRTSSVYSNWRAEGSLKDFLVCHHLLAVSGIDTRALVRHVRTRGALRCMLSTSDLSKDSLVKKAGALPAMVGWDLASRVTTSEIKKWPCEGPAQPVFHVVAFDFGIKRNILRQLAGHRCRITVVPARTSANQVRRLNPDGVFLSNGPGDPEPLTYAVETIRQLLGRVPVFGICLGHQLVGLALGGKTYKLKFGHHGGNHPVRNLNTGRLEMTCQNHGFCLDAGSLDPQQVEITHLNLNDQTVEGLRHRQLPVFSVQYHPEAAPGPHDSNYLFEEFCALMKNFPAWKDSPARER